MLVLSQFIIFIEELNSIKTAIIKRINTVPKKIAIGTIKLAKRFAKLPSFELRNRKNIIAGRKTNARITNGMTTI